MSPVSWDPEPQHDRLVLGATRVLHLPIEEAIPCPVARLTFKGRRVKPATEIGVNSAIAQINTILLDTLLVPGRASVPEHDVLAMWRLPQRGGIEKRWHFGLPHTPLQTHP